MEENEHIEDNYTMKIEENNSIQQKIAELEAKDVPKKKNLKPILIPAGVALVVLIAIILFIKVGTSFKKVSVINNKSIDYSSKVLNELYDGNTNLLYSDLTLNPALTLFYAQGNEKVKDELNKYFETEDNILIGNYSKIHERYKSAYRRVSLSTSLWTNDNMSEISESTKDTASKLNFETKKGFSADQMNKWIKKKSHNKVEGDISDGDLADANSVIISTLYFNEKWKEKYKSDNISEGLFHGTTGDDHVVFLKSSENNYMETNEAIGFMKPYKDEGLYFVGILPKNNKTIKDVDIKELFKTRKSLEVEVKIPEFEYNTNIDLQEVLPKLGVKSIFENGNLDGIAPNLYVKKIYQKNYIKVNRKGTKAVSVNTTINSQWSEVSQRRTVYLDKPFIFAIYDETIEQVLFIGQVNNIRSQG